MIIALLLATVAPTNAIEKDVCSERDNPAACVRAVRRGQLKCGPDGTVDWDDNRSFPPPHCNRDGWNGRHYVIRRPAHHG